MSLLMFGIVILVIMAAAYLINYVFPAIPRIIRILVNIALGFVVLFLVLALFKLMPLPFNLT